MRERVKMPAFSQRNVASGLCRGWACLRTSQPDWLPTYSKTSTLRSRAIKRYSSFGRDVFRASLLRLGIGMSDQERYPIPCSACFMFSLMSGCNLRILLGSDFSLSFLLFGSPSLKSRYNNVAIVLVTPSRNDSVIIRFIIYPAPFTPHSFRWIQTHWFYNDITFCNK